MKARDLFERMGPAPVEAPPKPGIKPGAPPAPSRPAPTKYPNPFRRRRSPGIQPGPMPKPKACAEAKEEFKHGRYWPAWLTKSIRKSDEEANVNPASGMSHAPDCDCDVCEKRRAKRKARPMESKAKSLFGR